MLSVLKISQLFSAQYDVSIFVRLQKMQTLVVILRYYI